MLYLGSSSEFIRKIAMFQRRCARYICNRYHNTSSVSDMLNIINLPSLAERRLVSSHLVAVPSDILIVSDTRTRKYHPLIYRQIHTSKDTCRHSFFLYTIPQWNQLPINTLNLVHIPSVVVFRKQLTPAVLCNLLQLSLIFYKQFSYHLQIKLLLFLFGSFLYIVHACNSM